MLFKEAISKRLYELCEQYNYTPNKLAEISTIPPSTLNGIMNCKIENPSSYMIFKICKTLNITLKEFYDSDLFLIKNIEI